MTVLEVAWRVILPIFLILGVGFGMERIFRLDLRTLAKLNFHVFVPALVFKSLLGADLTGGAFMAIAAFAAVHAGILFLLGWLIATPPRLRRGRDLTALGSAFFNCGNYGFPLVALAFGGSMLGVAATVLMVQNLLSFTLGLWVFERRRGFWRLIPGLLRIPVVYAVALPFVLRRLEVDLPVPIRDAVGFLGDGLIPVALLTLGAQLTKSPGLRNAVPVGLTALLRLLVSPALAAGLLMLPAFGSLAGYRPVLIALAGLPVAVNVFILAAQYETDADLASQAVFWTTLSSAATMALLLAWVG